MSISEAAVVSSFRALSRIVVVSAGLLGGAFWSASAQASQAFPSVLLDELGMPCAPNCTVCHATPLGGSGTVVKKFGIAALIAGPIAQQDVDSVRRALANMAKVSPPIDSDGDGKPDLDELTVGTDPNSEGEERRICGPDYGCGAHISRVPPARSSGTALAIAGSVAALMALGFRRVSLRRR